MKDYILRLKTPEISGKKIGIFRVLCAIFGGLILSYFGMGLLVFIFPFSMEEGLFVSAYMYCIVWAFVAIWISLARTKYIALMRWFIPSIVFGIVLLIIFNV
ncbi:hypothetical protein [Aliarcobacter lanthieri]|uniref:hypothetical protein n=1 Tax=Aliarcobacter lanthieri TaxID=1355374 RepID=UPI003AAE2661